MAKNKRNMLKLALKSGVANGISNWQRCLSKGLKNKEVWEKKKEGHTEGIILAGAGFDERRGRLVSLSGRGKVCARKGDPKCLAELQPNPSTRSTVSKPRLTM